jgi:hypothetical protein
MLGQSMQAEVLSKLPDGSFVVRVADMAARMPLPRRAEPGAQVPLTLVALNPRPTFQVHRPGRARRLPKPGRSAAEGACRGSAGLRRRQGSRRPHPRRRPAGECPGAARLPGGAASDGAGASLSTAGKALGDVIAAAQKRTPQSNAALGRTPLLGAPGADAGRIAARPAGRAGEERPVLRIACGRMGAGRVRRPNWRPSRRRAAWRRRPIRPPPS